MHDSGSRWNNFEVVESGLTPAQELVALAVSLVLELNVALRCIGRSCHVNHNRVVDDHLGWSEWIDLLWISAKLLHCLTHRGKVDDAGNASEVLHDDSSRGELNLSVRLCSGVPID